MLVLAKSVPSDILKLEEVAFALVTTIVSQSRDLKCVSSTTNQFTANTRPHRAAQKGAWCPGVQVWNAARMARCCCWVKLCRLGLVSLLGARRVVAAKSPSQRRGDYTDC